MLFYLSACNNVKNVVKNKIELTELKTTYDVKVGDQMSYKVSIHRSAGSQAIVSIKNTEIVKELETKFKYNDKSKSQMSGGDGGIRFYTFQAIKTGSTNINRKRI